MCKRCFLFMAGQGHGLSLRAGTFYRGLARGLASDCLVSRRAFSGGGADTRAIAFNIRIQFFCIKNRADALTKLPPGKVDAQADAAPAGATNREMRRPSTETLEGFFYD